MLLFQFRRISLLCNDFYPILNINLQSLSETVNYHIFHNKKLIFLIISYFWTRCWKGPEESWWRQKREEKRMTSSNPEGEKVRNVAIEKIPLNLSSVLQNLPEPVSNQKDVL